MSGTSWTKKALTITLRLGTGQFGNGMGNAVKLKKLRMLVSVSKTGMPSMDKATAKIWGLTPTIMNEVSTLGIPLNMWRPGNTMLIEAGDEGGAMSIVYNGYLNRAYQNYDDAPETSLDLEGWGAQAEAIKPTDAVSYAGTVDVATIAQAIAYREGWTFENSGVTTRVTNPYLAGTAYQQIDDLKRMAGINAELDTSKNPKVLAIWPLFGTRGGMIPLINARSGLVGYPKYQSSGMSFKCLFNPSIRLNGQIKMESSVGGEPGQIKTAANSQTADPQTQQGGPNGLWYVFGLNLDLSAQLPGGPWFCDVNCMRVQIGSAPG